MVVLARLSGRTPVHCTSFHVLHTGPAPLERQRGEGAVPLIRKDLAVASYGCPTGAGRRTHRDDAAEDEEEKCNT
jgi:hypothetical protein